MKRVIKLSVLSAALCVATAAAASAGTLQLNIAFKGAETRAVWESLIKQFEQANPGVATKVAFVEEETYKVQLPAWLTSVAPDVVNWHEGERMAYYAKRGLLDDLTGDWQKNGWDTQFASLKTASSYHGKQFAMPTQYFAWGLYYRKDLFEKVGIKNEPTTWQAFLDDCKKLKAAGIAPIAVGGRDS